MNLNSRIVNDTRAARYFRFLAPLAILLALAALVLAPGIHRDLTKGGTIVGAIPPLALTAPVPGVALARCSYLVFPQC
jgi:hypothetical protein